MKLPKKYKDIVFVLWVAFWVVAFIGLVWFMADYVLDSLKQLKK